MKRRLCPLPHPSIQRQLRGERCNKLLAFSDGPVTVRCTRHKVMITFDESGQATVESPPRVVLETR
jgi:phage FluMu protein Com